MLYKYRSLRDFKFFVDIVLNQRLYASQYFDLNDPMEGHYLYSMGELSEDVVEKIKGEKEKFRICSLSKEPEHPLMWAHYADGHRGIVVGVEVDARHDVRPVTYSGLPEIREYISSATTKEILCHKSEVWMYEKEARAFTTQSYIKVEVRKIILGSRIDRSNKSLITKLVEKVLPEVEITDSISSKLY